jgi:hypothetical protein
MLFLIFFQLGHAFTVLVPHVISRKDITDGTERLMLRDIDRNTVAA